MRAQRLSAKSVADLIKPPYFLRGNEQSLSDHALPFAPNLSKPFSSRSKNLGKT